MVVWIVIIVILIVAFGPILWLRPSRRERRLAALRQRAYRQGMRVELRSLPARDVPPEERVTAGGKPLSTTRQWAVYQMPLGVRLRRLPSWRIARSAEGTAAAPGWSFEPGQRPDHEHLGAALEAVTPMLEDLPTDLTAVECDPHNIGAYWREGPETTVDRVDDLARRLAEMAAALRAVDERLQAGEGPGNI